MTGGWLWQEEGISLATPGWTGDILVTVLETDSEGLFEVYGVEMEHVSAAVQLDIPSGDPLPTVTVYFTSSVEQSVFVALPDGTHVELPTTCTAQADGSFLCWASYTPSGSEDSLHPVLCLHD